MTTLHKRNVRIGDFWMLFAWRHDLNTEFFSIKPAPSIQEHKLWMRIAMNDPNIWIFEDSNVSCPVGISSVDTSGIVNITVNPFVRGSGYGVLIIQALQEMFNKLTANIVIGNVSGLKLFKKCGFESVEQIQAPKPLLVMQWRKE